MTIKRSAAGKMYSHFINQILQKKRRTWQTALPWGYGLPRKANFPRQLAPVPLFLFDGEWLIGPARILFLSFRRRGSSRPSVSIHELMGDSRKFSYYATGDELVRTAWQQDLAGNNGWSHRFDGCFSYGPG
jgi:hypothetical protein